MYIGPRMNVFLYPYSWVSRGVSRVRDRLYRGGIFAAKRCGLRVVSIGNISLGGTGKTPLALELVRLLQAEGLRTALVTRGYKGRWEKRGGMLTDGSTFYGGWEEGGDEPFMIARNAPGVGIFVGAHRLRSCRLAKVKGFEAVVLDDGFQHRKLHRDLDIVLFNPKEKILREPLAAMGRARIILIPEEEVPFHRDSLCRHFPDAQIYTYDVMAKGLVRVNGRTAPVPTASFRNIPFLAFCAIARPQRFFDLAERQHLELAARLTFPDHHPYPESTLERIARKCDELKPQAVVTTEKDSVKLARRTAFLKDIPLYYLKIGLSVQAGFFDQVRKSFHSRERRRP